MQLILWGKKIILLTHLHSLRPKQAWQLRELFTYKGNFLENIWRKNVDQKPDIQIFCDGTF